MFKICILFVIITPSITPSMRYFSTLKVRVFTYSNVPSLPYHTILYCYNCGRPFKVCLIKLEVDFSDNTLYSFYLNFYWFNFSSFKDCNFSIIDLIRNISDIHQFRYFQTPHTQYGASLYIEMCVCACHFFGSMIFCQNPSIVSISQLLSSNRQKQAYLMNMFHHSLYSQYNSRKQYLNKKRS